MCRVVLPLVVLVLALGFASPALGADRAVAPAADGAIAQLPTPTRGPGTPTATPAAPPIPRGTPLPPGARPDVQATATAAIATITAADATATAQTASANATATAAIGAPLTAIAATATALAVPTATATAAATPTAALTLPPTPPATTPTVPTTPATPTTPTTPTVAATPSPTGTPEPLAVTRTVLITAPIAVGDQTIAAGSAVEIPLDVPLRDGAIPPSTAVRLPGGQVIVLPGDTRIPAVENPTNVGAPLNVVLPRPSQVGDTVYPQNTVLVVPPGTGVLGSLEPGATILLQAGTAVQVEGRMQTLVEPLQVVVSPQPVPRPPALPATGDADPVLWPAWAGLALLVLGWRLRRSAG